MGEGYSAEASTWEPASNVGEGAIAEYLSIACARRRRPNGAAEAELEDEVSFVPGAEDMVSFEVSVTRR